MKIESDTNLYCIFGKPVRHSLSPVIHNALFSRYSIKSVYLAFEPDNIQNAINSIRTLEIKGASITIPYKIEVIKYLDEISHEAEMIASVNTLVYSGGKISGHNTDGYGVIQPLRDRGLDLIGRKVLIIGNGGSARSAAFSMIENGADVIIAGRSDDKIRLLEKDLNHKKNSASSVNIKFIDEIFMKQIDIIINTTPVGMTPDVKESPLDLKLINENHTVFDIVYKPDKTALIQNAEEKGCIVIKGINMLIYQAMKQFELWTGIIPDVSVIYKALNIIPE